MKNLIALNASNIYLKPGEVYVSRKPALISTVLGSCVAVTMYSACREFGAICHAMLPVNSGREYDLRYVDTALQFLYSKVIECGADKDLVVKLFGGAQVLDAAGAGRETVGDQNVKQVEAELALLGLTISTRDTGGFRGRKLFFCTRSGDVFLRRMHHGR